MSDIRSSENPLPGPAEQRFPDAWISRAGRAYRRARNAFVGEVPAEVDGRTSHDGFVALSKRSGATRMGNILDEYCLEPPTAQTAVDIFAGEWATGIPAPFGGVNAGHMALFSDERVSWGIESLGGVEQARVLEIGPLEGAHTYMLDRMGAREVVAVEANARAYLKCLILKELVGIPSASFQYGDATRYIERELEQNAPMFDLCLASGVLYHFNAPISALDLLCQASDRLVLWTHYFDAERILEKDYLRHRFSEPSVDEYDGFRFTRFQHAYGQALGESNFYGGTVPTSTWLERHTILAALEHFGFDVVSIGFEEPAHPNGPCFAVSARRRSANVN